MLDLYCSDCSALVLNPREHVDSHLHDRFEVHLSDGSRISVGDMGVDAAVAAEDEQRRVEAEQRSEADFRQRSAENASRLAAARQALAEARQALSQVGPGIAAISDSLGAIAVDLSAAEARSRKAFRGIEAAHRRARAEVGRWPTESICVPGTSPAEVAAVREYCAATHELVHRAEQDYEGPRQVTQALYKQRERLERQLHDLGAQKKWAEDVLPDRQQAVEWLESTVWADQSEKVRRMQASLKPRKTEPIRGLARQKAELARVIREINARLARSADSVTL